MERYKVSQECVDPIDDPRLSGSESGFLGHLKQCTQQAEEEFSRLEEAAILQANIGNALEGVNAGMWAEYMQSCGDVPLSAVEHSAPAKSFGSTFQHDAETGYLKDAHTGLYYDPASMYFFPSDFSKSFIYCHEEQLLCEVDAVRQKKANGERRPMPGVRQTVSSRKRRKVDEKTHRHAAQASQASCPAQISAPPQSTFYTWSSAPRITKPPRESNPSAPNSLLPVPLNGNAARIRTPQPRCEAEVPQKVPVTQSTARASKGSSGTSKRKRHDEVLGLVGGPDNRAEKPLVQPSRPIVFRNGSSADGAKPVVPKPTVTDSKQEDGACALLDPICHLCKRKFGTWEMLAKHERMSDLHKQNLAAQAEKWNAKQ